MAGKEEGKTRTPPIKGSFLKPFCWVSYPFLKAFLKETCNPQLMFAYVCYGELQSWHEGKDNLLTGKHPVLDLILREFLGTEILSRPESLQ